MRRQRHRPQPSSKPDDSIQLVDAIPRISQLPQIDGLTALAASLRFLDNNPGLEGQLTAIGATRTTEILHELEQDPETEMFLVSERNVRAIFAKAAHETLALTTLEVGAAIADDTALRHQFDATETEVPSILPGTATEPQGDT